MRRIAGPRMRGRLDLALCCLLATLAIVAWALTGPVLGGQKPVHRLMLVFDVSQSMNVRDGAPVDPASGPPGGTGPAALRPTRIEAARAAARVLIDELACGSEVGIGMFTEYRTYLMLLPVEVCADHDELRGTLATVGVDIAWSSGSEIAKGLYSAMRSLRTLEHPPALLFFTDGHEAPPLSPRYRPAFDGTPGEIAGALVGVGGDEPMPIPKTDLEGRPLGVWRADEVVQGDPRRLGKAGALVDDAEAAQRAIPPWYRVGNEHLSSLKEAYLRALAGEVGLDYLRLDSPQVLARTLRSGRYAQRVVTDIDAVPWVLPAALVALLVAVLAAGRGLRGRRSTQDFGGASS